jgi:RNA polymerase sigma factor (sigma-70 family)
MMTLERGEHDMRTSRRFFLERIRPRRRNDPRRWPIGAPMLSPGLLLPHASDSALLARWRNGDRTAGLCLLRREVQPIRRYFARRVSCRADVEDLVQRTLLASVDALPRFRRDAELSRFVRAIASKLLLRYRRDGERARLRLDAEVRPDAMQAGQPSPLAWVCHADDLQRLRDAFRELPDGSARLLHLRYWEERDTSEIAQLLEVNPGAVRTRLHRARHEVKRALTGVTEPEELESTEVRARARPRAASRRGSKEIR